MGFSALQLETSSRSRTLAAQAPAKINLILDVLGRRADGFHEIHSLALGVGLFDRLTCRWPNPHGLTFSCSDPTLHPDDNLASRAALLLAQHQGCDPQVAIDLQKKIPVGAGLGGGSSDAATALRVCNELWSTGLNDLELAQLGADLGSDVPLFFHLPSVEISGRGECVSPFRLRWTGYVLLVFPPIHTSTADVYRAWRMNDAVGADAKSFAELRELTRADDFHTQLRNQLEPAVFRVSPGVKQIYDALSSLDLHPRVTGSGSALFRLFDDQDQANHAARRVGQELANVAVEVVAAPVGNCAPSYKES